ncbi:hypothetical protein ACWGRF_01915 [Streptomyces zhihengii]
MTEQTTDTPTVDGDALRAAIARKAVLTALSDAIKDEVKAANAEVQQHIEAAAKATGSTKWDATLPDGTKVGSLALKGGEAAAQVVDVAELTAWVRAEYATEVTPRIEFMIAPAFLAKVLAEATAAGRAEYADPVTGVVHELPGVQIRPSRARTNQLTFSRGSKSQPLSGRELVGQAWSAGRLASVLPALAPAPPAADGAE